MCIWAGETLNSYRHVLEGKYWEIRQLCLKSVFIHLISIYILSSCLTEDILHLNYKDIRAVTSDILCHITVTVKRNT